MRALVARERGEASLWDMKNAPGGLIDLEFLAQAVLLGHAASHPGLCLRHPGLILAEAGRLGLLDGTTVAALLDAHRLQATLLHLMRFMAGSATDPKALGRSVTERLCQIAHQPDLAHLKADLLLGREAVRHSWTRLLEAGRLTGDAAIAAPPSR